MSQLVALHRQLCRYKVAEEGEAVAVEGVVGVEAVVRIGGVVEVEVGAVVGTVVDRMHGSRTRSRRRRS